MSNIYSNCLIKKKNLDTDYFPNDVMHHILSFLTQCSECNVYNTHKHLNCYLCKRKWCTTCIRINTHIKIKYCYHSKSKMCNYCLYTFQYPMIICL
jgi:hypothetical protein